MEDGGGDLEAVTTDGREVRVASAVVRVPARIECPRSMFYSLSFQQCKGKKRQSEDDCGGSHQDFARL